MSYDLWKLTDPSDVETEPRWDDETTSVEECVHGEHPLECSLCTSAGLIAAVSGEGEDMQEADRNKLLVEVKLMETTDLVALRYQIENELKRRVDEHEREAKAARMALDNIKPRAKRKDAGTTRRKPEAA
jgi:hypothetical protein